MTLTMPIMWRMLALLLHLGNVSLLCHARPQPQQASAAPSPTSTNSNAPYNPSNGWKNGGNAAYAKRTIFYAGGNYVTTSSGTYLEDSQYVEVLVPEKPTQPNPIVFVHGGGYTGVQWLNKPDGGAGWATYYLNRGYTVYIIDLWTTARSADPGLPPIIGGTTVEIAQSAFSAPQLYHKYYQAQFHTQFPGTGVRGDPDFDAFFANNRPLGSNFTQVEYVVRASTCVLLKKIGTPSFFITHSYGGMAALLATDQCPQYVKGHVSLEDDQSPFTNYDGGTQGATTGAPSRPYGLTFTPVVYNPPITNPSQLQTMTNGTLQYKDGLISKYPCILQKEPARQLTNIAKAPVLFLTTQASVHAMYDQCQVQYMRQAGVTVDHVYLANKGIDGNGHFMMLEKNSDDIASLAETWIAKHAG